MFFLFFPDKKISPELEQECIKANISVYNNLAVCILANARENVAVSNVDQEYEKVVKYTGMVYKIFFELFEQFFSLFSNQLSF